MPKQNAPHVDWTAVYADRRARLSALLRAANIDALLVSQAANRFYLSGFELHDGQPNETSGFLIITADGNNWLATDSRFEQAAAQLWPKDEICIYAANSWKAIANLLSRLGSIIGLDLKGLSANSVRLLKKYATCNFVAADGLVEKMREIKQPCEIAALKNSFRLNHAMLDWLKSELDSNRLNGLSEKELAWEIEKYFRSNGAQELAFNTIAAIGKNGALPHAIPGEDSLAPNLPLLIDVGCRVDNYCSDQTRTFWLGPDPAPEFTKALQLVRDAQQAALDAMRPGVACSEIYNIAYDVFERAGVEKAFTHGLGHGVGLETHELPSLSRQSSQTLRENMVVTVEPGLYYPAWGGIRWEYTVLILADGIEIL